ncbi:unnamed protein product [Cunninghamella echinulata]
MSNISSVGDNNICRSNQCYKISDNILNSIDFNINPCDDFYQYSCGSWLKNTHLDTNQSEASQFYYVDKQNENTISILLQSTYTELLEKVNDKSMLPQTEKEKKLDQQLFTTMTNYFDACMNTTLLQQLGPIPIYPHLITLLENEKKDHQTFTELLVSQLYENEFPLFGIDTIPDHQQPHRNAIWIYKVSPLFPSIDIKNNKTQLEQLEEDLFQFTSTILSSASSSFLKDKSYQQLDLTKELIHKKVNHTIFFDLLLSQIIHDIEMDKTINYNYSSFSNEFATKNNIIDWIQFLNHLIEPTMISSSLLASTNIYISDIGYFEALSTWMQQKNEKELKEIIHDYIFIRYLFQKSVFLDESFFPSQKRTTSTRLDHCVSLTSIELDQLVGRYFMLYNQFNEAKRINVLNFLKQIQIIWQQRLIQQQQNHHDKHHHQTQWLDDHTINMMLDKLNKIEFETVYDIIYPDIRSPTALASFYNNNNNNEDDEVDDHVLPHLDHVSATHFFQNHIVLKQLQQSRIWFNLYKININGTVFSSTFVDNQDFFPLFTPNAYYIPEYNKIVVPAGLLFPPFFYSNDEDLSSPSSSSLPSSSSSSSSIFPMHMNFGSLGMILAHELTHAFDLNGRLYNSDGKKGNWWSNDTLNRFTDKVQCFIDQYSNMTVYDEKNKKTLFIDGKLTLNENLADNGGLSVAYDTLKAMQASSSSPQYSLLLPNIHLSPEQLFYIHFAQSFCSKLSPDSLIQQVSTNNHPPTSIRVNGVIQNSETFASHFNCPIGSSMNPKKKCKLW